MRRNLSARCCIRSTHLRRFAPAPTAIGFGQHRTIKTAVPCAGSGHSCRGALRKSLLFNMRYCLVSSPNSAYKCKQQGAKLRHEYSGIFEVKTSVLIPKKRSDGSRSAALNSR